MLDATVEVRPDDLAGGGAFHPQLAQSWSTMRSPNPPVGTGGFAYRRDAATVVLDLDAKRPVAVVNHDAGCSAGVFDRVGHEFGEDKQRVRRPLARPKPSRAVTLRRASAAAFGVSALIVRVSVAIRAALGFVGRSHSPSLNPHSATGPDGSRRPRGTTCDCDSGAMSIRAAPSRSIGPAPRSRRRWTESSTSPKSARCAPRSSRSPPAWWKLTSRRSRSRTPPGCGASSGCRPKQPHVAAT